MDTSTEKKKKPSIVGRIILFIKLLVILVLLVSSGVLGAILGVKLYQYNNRDQISRVTEMEKRIETLVGTVGELENKNNELQTENQGLRERLQLESDKLQEEQKGKEVSYNVSELGKRLKILEIADPKVYLEFEREYGEPTVTVNPAQFSDDVVAEGIEVTFANSLVKIEIEPWKTAGSADEVLKNYSLKTADGKDVKVNVYKEASGLMRVTANVFGQDNTQDKLKMAVTLRAANESELSFATAAVDSIVRSTEIDFSTL